MCPGAGHIYTYIFLAILNAFLVLWEVWLRGAGAMASTIAPAVDTFFSDYYIYFLMEKNLYFLSHSLYVNYNFYKIWVKTNVIYSYYSENTQEHQVVVKSTW